MKIESKIQDGSNMTGTDLYKRTHNQSRSYLNLLVIKPLDTGKPETEGDIKFNCFSRLLAILKERKIIH